MTDTHSVLLLPKAQPRLRRKMAMRFAAIDRKATTCGVTASGAAKNGPAASCSPDADAPVDGTQSGR
jgi:hypothetical protein